MKRLNPDLHRRIVACLNEAALLLEQDIVLQTKLGRVRLSTQGDVRKAIEEAT